MNPSVIPNDPDYIPMIRLELPSGAIKSYPINKLVPKPAKSKGWHVIIAGPATGTLVECQSRTDGRCTFFAFTDVKREHLDDIEASYIIPVNLIRWP